jgi:hypothetical protein
MVQLAKFQNTIYKLFGIIAPEEVYVSQAAVIKDPHLGFLRTLLLIAFAVYVSWSFLLQDDPFQHEVTPTAFRSFWASPGQLSLKKAEVERGLLPDYCTNPVYYWSSTGTLHHDFICITGSYNEMHHLGETTIFFPTHVDQRTTKQTRCKETNMTAFCEEQGVQHP